MNERGEALGDQPVEGQEGHVVDSVTGVDVSLQIAGPGARAFAFVLDWHIRAVLTIAWFVVAVLLYNRRWSLQAPDDPDTAWTVLVALPPIAIYLLYPCVMEIVMRGRTPGKRMAGVRLVTHDGSVPAVSAFLLRNVFRLIDSFPAFYGVGLIASVITKNHVRIGDLAAGTLLVYEGTDESVLEHVSAQALGAQLDGPTADIVNDLLRRWNELDVNARMRLARIVLSGATRTDWSAVEDGALHAALERIARGEPA